MPIDPSRGAEGGASTTILFVVDADSQALERLTVDIAGLKRAHEQG